MKRRRGPLLTTDQQLAASVPVEQTDYSYRCARAIYLHTYSLHVITYIYMSLSPLCMCIPRARTHTHRSSLVAPPMIFQTRSRASPCTTAYSREWALQQALAQRSKCAPPVCLCLCVCGSVCLCLCVCVCIHTYTHTNTYMYMYINIHTCMYTHNTHTAHVRCSNGVTSRV